MRGTARGGGDTVGSIALAFRRDHLLSLAHGRRDAYASAAPFPHAVFDDFLPPDLLEGVLAEFPERTDGEWQRFDDRREVKLALADTERMGPHTRALLGELNGQVFIEFLERLTGIEGLVPDPHLAGGGLHQIAAGGFLKIHADFNRHNRLRLDRRLNGLLFLNKDWQDDYGGHLELWSTDMARCERSLLPVFNRFVLFSTTDQAFHGHPDALTCPPDRTRRSVALYYYTNGRPDSEVSGDHTTLFRERPGERWQRTARQTAKRWVPPAITEWVASRRGS